jgi:hypothetical protein
MGLALRSGDFGQKKSAYLTLALFLPWPQPVYLDRLGTSAKLTMNAARGSAKKESVAGMVRYDPKPNKTQRRMMDARPQKTKSPRPSTIHPTTSYSPSSSWSPSDRPSSSASPNTSSSPTGPTSMPTSWFCLGLGERGCVVDTDCCWSDVKCDMGSAGIVCMTIGTIVAARATRTVVVVSGVVLTMVASAK